MIASRSGALRIIHARAADWAITMSDSTTIIAGPSLDRLFDILRSLHFTDHVLPERWAAISR
jgi:hypothetical protein